MESAAHGAVLYGTACADVIASAGAAAQLADEVLAAEKKAEEQQHPLSRQSILGFAHESEQRFNARYRAFEEARATARDVATAFRVAAASEDLDVEAVLAHTLDDDAYPPTEVAGHILRTTYGPTPAAFLDGVKVTNAAVAADVHYFGDSGFIGHVYSAPVD